MFENLYTTKMSANKKTLQNRFTKIRRGSGRFSKFCVWTDGRDDNNAHCGFPETIPALGLLVVSQAVGAPSGTEAPPEKVAGDRIPSGEKGLSDRNAVP